MITRRIKITKPGDYEYIVRYRKLGERKELIIAVDARLSGEYAIVVVADHESRQTDGRITVRAVVGELSKVSIRGMIRIRKNASQVNNFLELRAINMSHKAQTTLVPELEIESDQVKASHAASASTIDLQQLRLLRRVGIEEQKAKKLIVEGFLRV